MLDVPVYNTSGEQTDTLQVDEGLFGGAVNAPLIKQAIVAYQRSMRQGTVATKGRGMVAGSTKKLFRQKGTGNARRGSLRTGKVVGGGMTFAKVPRTFRSTLPKRMRRAALRSAMLAKMLGGDFLVVDGLSMDTPRTKTLAGMLTALGVNRRCVLALGERDRNIYLSSRNLRDLTVRIVEELNAYDVATRPKMIVTREAMDQLTGASKEVEA
jgi:large subunit ribosomal protein L4